MRDPLGYSPLDHSLNQIRLLRLECQGGEGTQANILTAKLEVHALQACPDFDAVSYAWGGSSRHNIFIDGGEASVTPNLHAILQVLQQVSDHYRFLWVDALCINQQNLDERSSQVTLMREIYTKASTVHIWLGRGDDSTVETLRSVDRAGRRPGSDLADSHLLQGEIDGLSSSNLEKVFRNTWWDRLWTVQEAVMARNARAHFGQHAVHFPRLLMGILAIFRLRDQTRPGQTLPYYMMRLAMKFSAPILAASKPDRTEFERLPDLLAALRGSKVTVPHDMIYGILGLLPPQLGVSPDYTKPLAEVYEDFTLRVLKHEKSLDVLALGGMHGGRSTGLPSWVPVYEKASPFLFRATSGFDASRTSRSDAILGYPEAIVQQKDGGRIELSAHIMHTVEIVLSPCPQDIPGDFLRADTDTRAHHIDRLQQRLCECIFKLHHSSRSLDDTIALVWRTLQAGTTLSERLSQQGQQFRTWLFAQHPEKYSHEYDAMLATFLGSKQCRLLAIKDKDVIGVVSGMVIEGDVLAILAGASTPYLLREKKIEGQSAYELVGHVFVSGVMLGEAVTDAATARNCDPQDVTGVFERITVV
ncbi:Putative heterokaryon incompatibility [Septoria linicola]|uniref:Heterokaryon incompatibility n=1 Tax=Septoria linicola TaxID=215465 RepID=A0A9Q9APV3_9PEZI|nr:putative heterokaryon incompatibility [Septoria linicola]USW52269.1 Putative heterokaryon incompatibility [Septoria linicola]